MLSPSGTLTQKTIASFLAISSLVISEVFLIHKEYCGSLSSGNTFSFLVNFIEVAVPGAVVSVSTATSKGEANVANDECLPV